MQIQAAEGEDRDVGFGLAGKIVLLSGLTLSSYALFGLAPILPVIAAHFSDTPNAGMLARMLISAAGVTVALTSPIAGAIADRLGPRRVLLVSMWIYALVGCAPFFLNDLHAILVTRVVMGLAIAALGSVILTILVTHSSGAPRNRWMGYLTTTATVVAVIYSPLVGYIGHFGWRWTFMTYLLVVPLIVMTMRGIPPDAAREKKAQDSTKAPARFVLGTPLTFIIFLFLAGAVLVSPAIYFPFRMREMGITDTRVIGLLTMPCALAGIVGGLGYGWIRSKLSLPSAFIVGFCIQAVGLVGMAMAQDSAQIIVSQATFGFGQGMNMPSYFMLASITGPDAYRARTMGFTKSGVYGGTMIGQLIMEPIVARSNFSFVLMVFAACCVAFALFYAWQVIGLRRVQVQQT